MAIELLATNIELGLVTTNLDAMVGFYEGFLGLPHQGDLDFPGGTMRRYAIGNNVLKLVTLDEPPTGRTPPVQDHAHPAAGHTRLGLAD